MDLTDKLGSELKDYIKSECKYKIRIKGTPYNERGAYCMFENCYIQSGSELYNEFTKPRKLKTLYVEYYNHKKPNNHKDSNAPGVITEDMIEYIKLDELPLDHVEYYM